MNIHDIIRLSAYPPIIDVLFAAIFVMYSPIGLGNLDKLSAFTVSLIFVSLIPLVSILLYVKKGETDLDVSMKEKRTMFYLIAIASYIAGIVVFAYFQTKILILLTGVYAITAGLFSMINTKWKISTHSAGVAGPITAIIYIFGLYYLFAYIFVALVMWSRIKIKAHTLFQTIAGTVLASVITGMVFFLFY